MSVSLTEAAANRVRQFLTDRGKGIGLRLGVTRTGCSGMAYVVDFADAIEPDDRVYESNGIKVIIDASSLPYVEGMEIDFVRDGLSEAFHYRNPNVKSMCGCGESFNV